MLLNELLQWNAHLLLHHTRVVHVPTDAEQFRALVPLPSERREPGRPTPTDGWRDSNCLDICHGSGATEESNISRERRLEARLSLFSLKTLYQRRLLSANVRTRATVEVDIK